MYNFEHEIIEPQDKAIKKFLWSDYFHDGKIENITFQNKRIIITLDCQREKESEWKHLNGTDDEKRKYMKENAEKYVYDLIFEGIHFWNMRCEDKWDFSPEYINGRFKDSAKLKIIEVRSKKKLYHLRVQLSTGFFDVIFKCFQIRKKTGKINYRIPADWFIVPPFMRENYDISQDIITASDGDDIDRYCSMLALFCKEYYGLADIARNNLALDDSDSSALAAYILGKIGTGEDIVKLKEYYNYVDNKLYKETPWYALLLQSIDDSIEMIKCREKKESTYKE